MGAAGKIIQFPQSGAIDVQTLRANNNKLAAGLIAPPIEEVTDEVVEEHDAEPVKSMEDIYRISHYLIGEGRYRDNMLFIVGINFGLRVSDLVNLRFSNLINDNCTFKDRFAVFEKKTRNTRKRKKNRYITINQAVIETVTLYLEHTPGVSLSDYMFRSESPNGKDVNRPLSPRSVNRILEKIHDDLELNFRFSSHSLRKTFGYHQIMMGGNTERQLLLLQEMFGHSSAVQTLAYIGITDEEISDAYRGLNLGSEEYNYLAGNQIIEEEVQSDVRLA